MWLQTLTYLPVAEPSTLSTIKTKSDDSGLVIFSVTVATLASSGWLCIDCSKQMKTTVERKIVDSNVPSAWVVY